MNRHLVFFVIVSLSITGCATIKKDWEATGGSRADGVVNLSVEHRLFESIETNTKQGLELAKSKCVAWGFKDAEAFGGATNTCNDFSYNECRSWIYTKQYQCLGSLEK